MRNLKPLRSGVGGIWTPVQTWNWWAFYMLSHVLVFVPRQGRNTQPAALAPWSFGWHQERTPSYSRFNCTAISRSLGTRTLGRCLVRITVTRIRLIYCTSIKQRERKNFRHLNFWCLSLKSVGIIALHAYWPLLHAVKTGQPHLFSQSLGLQR